LKVTVTGDIGCYTLGALPPHSAIHTTFCMGAGIGNAFGLEKAQKEAISDKLVAVIGDSTFLHSGTPALVDIVFNKGITTVVICDNLTTGMTGHQPHPGTGKTAKGEPTYAIDYEQLIRAIGIRHIRVVDPYNLKETDLFSDRMSRPGGLRRETDHRPREVRRLWLLCADLQT